VHHASREVSKELLVSSDWEAGWFMEPVWMVWRKQKFFVPVRNQTTILCLKMQYAMYYAQSGHTTSCLVFIQLL